MKNIIVAIFILALFNTAFITYHIYKTQFDLGCMTDTECEQQDD
jgi:hypothetical protein